MAPAPSACAASGPAGPGACSRPLLDGHRGRTRHGHLALGALQPEHRGRRLLDRLLLLQLVLHPQRRSPTSTSRRSRRRSCTRGRWPLRSSSIWCGRSSSWPCSRWAGAGPRRRGPRFSGEQVPVLGGGRLLLRGGAGGVRRGRRFGCWSSCGGRRAGAGCTRSSRWPAWARWPRRSPWRFLAPNGYTTRAYYGTDCRAQALLVGAAISSG